MIKVQLPNGKTVFMPLEDYLELDDIGYQELMADDEGYEISDYFTPPILDIDTIKEDPKEDYEEE